MKRQPESFEVNVTIAQGDGDIRMRLCQYVGSDMDRREGIGLGVAAAQLACKAMEIIRGRLQTDRLVRAVAQKAINKLSTMSVLYHSHLQRHPELRQRALTLPVRARGINAVVRSADHFEACVHLTVGRTNYLSTVVFNHRGGRWMCTALDLG
ncbi:Rv3235 family protein [Bifidobacterium vespertilionis]|uniref:Uncharacterized protein n=1 Tax=Bifidobacterium vespertilionis TaxID=2562524 RepID=A0A5J5E4P9_9BIFI|nr:Rv3235 family protein [Bifidobacterium vespertilionis]KAA8822540.1 hypothetical protein EMO90_00680 [Bifidobacterium vespertilionis]KAA8824175.1 hypothetical protein EM848_03355 [Bifidobacterium vespertilionis]MBT1178761.1 hypothetical protein [Bifidobacterium vespertilionis]